MGIDFNNKEHIQPYVQPSQEKENSYGSIQLGFLEENMAIYDEFDSEYDDEEEKEFLSQKSPKLSQVEEEAVLDQAYFPNPHIQVLFQDPFADLLETSKRGVCHAKRSLIQNFKNILGSTVQTLVRWECPFDFFTTLKELKQNHSWNHLLEWLYWKREFTK